MCWRAVIPSHHSPFIKNQILDSQDKASSIWGRDAVGLAANLLCSRSILSVRLAISIDHKACVWRKQKRLQVLYGHKSYLKTKICSVCSIIKHWSQSDWHISCCVSVKYFFSSSRSSFNFRVAASVPSCVHVDSKSASEISFLSLHPARPHIGNHRVLLLWRPPQLPAPKKRIVPEFPSRRWLLSQRLDPKWAHKVCLAVSS